MNGWNKTHNLRRNRKWLKRLTNIKTWQLLIILLFFVMLAAIFLRLNNLGMVERRHELIEADKTGDIVRVQEAATRLQNYVARHMNTATGPMALQNTYDVSVQAAIEAVRPPDINSEAYQAATDNCEARFRGNSVAVANCVTAWVGENSGANFQEPVMPNSDAYYLSFAPPRISLDPAGISVLMCILIIVVILARFVTVVILRVLLRYKYRSV